VKGKHKFGKNDFFGIGVMELIRNIVDKEREAEVRYKQC